MKDNKKMETPIIVVVEDNKDLSRLIQKRLRELGFSTESSSTGKDALEKLPGLQNSIILLDYMLPDMTAIEFIQELDRKKLNIPFVVMTGHGSEYAAVDIMKRGARDYIIKDSNIIEMLPHRIRAIARDLKHEKELADTATALSESEAKYRDLFELANDAIFIADADTGVIIDANKRAEEMIGVPVEQIRGMHQTDLHPKEETEQYSKIFQKHIKDGSAISEEIYVVNNKGERIAVEISANVEEVAGRKVVNGIFRDISERNKTENLLLERVQLAALGDSIGKALSSTEPVDMMLSRCSEILVHHLNAAFARIWTLDETENVLELRASAGMYTHIDGAHSRIPVGHHKIGLIAEERRPHLSNNVIGDPRVHDQEWAIKQGIKAFVGHPLIVGNRLTGVMAMFSQAPFTEATLTALSSVANEIAIGIVRKQTENQLAISLNEKEILLRELYHRTKNNMQVISSLLNLQSISIDDENVLTIFRETQNRIRSIGLVHEKLYQSNDLARISLSDYIQDLTGTLLTIYGKSDKVSLNLDTDSVIISIDTAIPCGLIINELITNSLKYAFPGNKRGVITVAVNSSDETVELRISDNGTGLPKEFDFRSAKSLGLKLVRQLTDKQLHGKISCKSTEGVEFIIQFKNKEIRTMNCYDKEEKNINR